MPKHTITCEVQPVEVVNSDVIIKVRQDAVLFGTLTLSRGSIDWRPGKKWRGKKNEIQLTWTQFNRAMNDYKEK
jgi:hypothetical protein